MDNKLAAKVRAVNAAHKYANELYPILAKIFEPFVGQKVMKIGGLLAKIQSLLPELPCTPGLHVHRAPSSYSLAWTISKYESVGGEGASYDVTIYVGGLDNGTLKELYSAQYHYTHYTPEHVLQVREAYKQAKKASDDAFSALHPFGEWDR